VGTASRDNEAARSRRLSSLVFLCGRAVGENPRSGRGEKVPQSGALLSSPIPFLLPNDDLSPDPNGGMPPLPEMEPDGDDRGGRPEEEMQESARRWAAAQRVVATRAPP
jgi:hypothetical protein